MSEATWYYSKNGTRNGPFTIDQMKGFAASSMIDLETKVWSGSGDWVSLTETELAASVPPLSGPPPLASADVDNRFAWALVGVQIIGALLSLLFNSDMGWFALIINVILCVIDERRLKAAGYAAPETYWAVLIPVYLWKRANLIGHSKNYFYAWIAGFVLLMLVSFMGSDSEIEEAACPIVTNIIHNQFYQKASCIAVAIDDEPKDDFYTATAYLDNGNQLDITIEKKQNHIMVRIPPQ